MQALAKQVLIAEGSDEETQQILVKVEYNRRAQQDECERMQKSAGQMRDALQAAEQRASAAEQTAAAADQNAAAAAQNAAAGAAAAQQSAADATAAAQVQVPSSFLCAEQVAAT